jgi:hypothetical protein
MPRFTVEVSEQAFASLAERAQEERRPLRDEAGWLLERLLLNAQPWTAANEAARQPEPIA